eukprot:684354-Pleurochrysis_carterae.AAC.1
MPRRADYLHFPPPAPIFNHSPLQTLISPAAPFPPRSELTVHPVLPQAYFTSSSPSSILSQSNAPEDVMRT